MGHTQETKDKISLAKKGVSVKHSKQFKEGIIPWNKGTIIIVKLNCKGCGIEFESPKYKYRKYCSHPCSLKHRTIWNKGIPWDIETRLKVSQTKKGVPNIACKGKPNLKMRGKNHPNYKHGHFANSVNKSIEWKQWRESVFERDNYTCQECNVKGSELTPHHILRKSHYPDLIFNQDNGITLCRKCHDKTINNEFKFVDKYQNMLEVVLPLESAQA